MPLGRGAGWKGRPRELSAVAMSPNGAVWCVRRESEETSKAGESADAPSKRVATRPRAQVRTADSEAGELDECSISIAYRLRWAQADSQTTVTEPHISFRWSLDPDLARTRHGRAP